MSYHRKRIRRIPAPLPHDYDPTPIQEKAGKIQPQDINKNLDGIEQAIDETQDRLLLIQRDDGAIRSHAVCWEQLCEEVQIAIRAGQAEFEHTYDVFIGDGVTLQWELTPGGPDESSLYLVVIDGVTQEPGKDYVVDTSGTITFSEPPPDGLRIVVRSWAFVIVPIQGGIQELQDQINDLQDGQDALFIQVGELQDGHDAQQVEIDALQDSSISQQAQIDGLTADSIELREDVDELQRTSTRYFYPEDIRNPQINGGVVSDGLFDMSVTEEMAWQTSGQDPQNQLPRLPGNLTGEAVINFAAEYSRFWEQAPIKLVNGIRALPIESIYSTVYSSLRSFNLFEPVNISESLTYSFRYIGERPLRTILKGGITFYRRINTAGEGYITTTLSLRPISNLPDYVGFQDNGRRHLGLSSAAFQQPAPLTNPQLIRDPLPRTFSGLDTILAGLPELWPGSENGYISSRSQFRDDEDLQTEDPPGSGNTIGPEVLTTNWFPIAPGDVVYLKPTNGVSLRRRFQVKYVDPADSSNYVVRYHAGASSDEAADGLFRMPTHPEVIAEGVAYDPAEARVYFTGTENPDLATQLSIKAIPYSQFPQSLDPAGGNWAADTITTQTDVIFYPGTVYAFQIISETIGFAAIEEDRFRVASGGFSFIFDAGAVLRSEIEKMLVEGQ